MIKIIDEDELRYEKIVEFPRVVIRHDRFIGDSYEVQSMFSGSLNTEEFYTEREALDYIKEELPDE